MSYKNPIPFFSALKETTKFISSEIDALKKAVNEEPNDESVTHIKCSELCTETKEMQKEAVKLLKTIKPKLAVTRNYFMDIQELIFEVDEEVVGIENYLKKFGYEPIEKDFSLLSISTTEEEEESNTPKISSTPELFSYFELEKRRELEKKCCLNSGSPIEQSESEPNLDATPTLNLNITAVKNEEAPITASDTEEPSIGNLYKYDKIVRKLEFK